MQRLSRTAMAALVLALRLMLAMVGLQMGSSQAAALNHRPTPTLLPLGPPVPAHYPAPGQLQAA
jgi:hypothetical protein